MVFSRAVRAAFTAPSSWPLFPVTYKEATLEGAADTSEDIEPGDVAASKRSPLEVGCAHLIARRDWAREASLCYGVKPQKLLAEGSHAEIGIGSRTSQAGRANIEEERLNIRAD